MTNNFKKYFQIFENYKKENHGELIYLDNASSSLTPDMVIEKMNQYYFNYRSNVDRAISKIAIQATTNYEEARTILAKFLNIEEEEIIWTSNATNSSNLLIQLLAKHDQEFNFLNPEDEILTTILEHHSSFLPLQELAKQKQMKLKFLELDQNFNLDLKNLAELVNSKTKIVSICLASNVLGTVNDLKKIIIEIKKINPKVFVICDLTAAFGHFTIDLQDLRKYLDAGYFSLHKAFGPTGVGVLFLKREISRNFSPVIFGGGIISNVSKEKTEYRNDIKLFEAGTPNIAGVIGAGQAIKFLEQIGLDNIAKQNKELTNYALQELQKLDFLKIFASPIENNLGIISFQVFVDNLEIHSHDVADILARRNIAVRAGHHCAEPLMNYLNIKNGLTRISLNIYNDQSDIDKLIEGLKEVREIFTKS